jgi:hypothetical protein
MAKSALGVIDSSRNLLLIMSIVLYVAESNDVTCVLYGKYPVGRSLGTIYNSNKLNHLHGIISKLFIACLLGTRLHGYEEISFRIGLRTGIYEGVALREKWLRNHLLC